MALAYDNASSGSDGTGLATSLTFSHTCTGSNLILIVTVATSPETDKVTGITYNGVAMTRIGQAGNAASQAVSSYMYYLINPATGAHNVVVSLSVASNINADAVSYTGALQSGQPDSSAVNNSSTGTTLNLTTTVVASNCWLISTYWNLNVRTKPAGATYRGTGTMTADSNGTVGTGSNTHQWSTDTSGSSQAGVVASIAPAPVVTGKGAALFALM